MNADPWAAWRAFSAWPGASVVPGAAAGPPPRSTPQDFVERFNQAARDFLASAGAQPAGVTAAPPADAAAADAARLFADALRDLFSAWQPPAPFGAAAGTGTRDPATGPTPPAFGLTRDHQLRWQRLGEASRQADEAQRRLQRHWLDALRDAGAAFGAALVRTAPEAAAGETATGTPAATIRRLYDTWIDCAEDAYSRMAHGTAFCDALADAVNAGSRWRHEVKALVEDSAKLLDLPTRSELNSLQQRLRAVEAELRGARCTLGAAAKNTPQRAPVAPHPTAPPAAAPKPRPRRPRKT